MIKIRADFKLTKKMLKDIAAKDIPAARISALNRAAEQGRTAARRAVSAEVKITQKYINGRFSRAKAKGRKGFKAASIAFYFRYRDKNVGTMDPVAVGGRQGRGKGRAGYVKVGSRKYERAWIYKGGKSQLVLQRDGKKRKPFSAVTIPIGLPAVKVARSAFTKKAQPVFKDRFQYEVDRRVKKRGAR